MIKLLILTVNLDNIVFTIKDTKLYAPVVTLSAKVNQKLSKLLSKGFEWSMYWNEHKTQSEEKNTTNNFRYFLELISLEVKRLFILIYTNQDDNVKRFNAKKYYLPKSIIKNYNAIINGRTFYNQLINSDIKRYEEIRTVTIGQGEDYTIGYLLDYE